MEIQYWGDIVVLSCTCYQSCSNILIESVANSGNTVLGRYCRIILYLLSVVQQYSEWIQSVLSGFTEDLSVTSLRNQGEMISGHARASHTRFIYKLRCFHGQ